MTVEAATGVLNRLSHWKSFSLALVLCGVSHETKAGPPGDPELFSHDEVVQLYEQEAPPDLMPLGNPDIRCLLRGGQTG